MKVNIFFMIFLLAGFSLLGVSCGKGGDDGPSAPNPPASEPNTPQPSDTSNPSDEPQPSPAYPTFDAPNWKVNNISSFEHTMTLSMILPDSLNGSYNIIDEIAVFAESECRGVAERFEVSSGKFIWLAIVYGNNVSEPLSIKYYSGKTKYLYQSDYTKNFVADELIGSVDNPVVIGMKIVTK